jgi:hypothetical protein
MSSRSAINWGPEMAEITRSTAVEGPTSSGGTRLGSGRPHAPVARTSAGRHSDVHSSSFSSIACVTACALLKTRRTSRSAAPGKSSCPGEYHRDASEQTPQLVLTDHLSHARQRWSVASWSKHQSGVSEDHCRASQGGISTRFSLGGATVTDRIATRRETACNGRMDSRPRNCRRNRGCFP